MNRYFVSGRHKIRVLALVFAINGSGLLQAHFGFSNMMFIAFASAFWLSFDGIAKRNFPV